ncbi:MAG: hypothetical protein DRR00_11875 [Candidatus Parabeggiatoa sp. nov. 3]|nr:MAG: hypothetical protein DRR00_11875 [Gammaproteobacteria bacterium]RKZ67172.1 MAG: hypothetical protein DRQ99_07485 [Gammaproteobacteria bacterium]
MERKKKPDWNESGNDQTTQPTSPQLLLLASFLSKNVTVKSYHLRFFFSQNPFKACRFSKNWELVSHL